MKLIVGLGNPGIIYTSSRHNIGFRCINHLARLHNIPLAERKSKTQFGRGKIADIEVVLAKPRTFMNLSGEAVGSIVRRFTLPLSDLIVIHDDLDLPLGKIRLRQGGSSGGHKGVDSIIDRLGSQDFSRIRVGIGRPQEDTLDIVPYVLGGFGSQEKAIIEGVIAQVAEAVLCLLTQGMTSAMNKYN